MANLTERVEYIISVQDKFTKSFQKVEKGMKGIQGEVEKTKKSTESLTSSLEEVAGALGLGMALKGFFNLGMELEKTRIQFEVLTGSAGAASQVIDDINKFAARTSFQQMDLQKHAQMMMNFGIETESVVDNLKMLGDVSGGDRNRMRALTLAFSQASATGRLMGQDLLQMVNAGFNPLKSISDETGRSMQDLKKDMEKGLISFDMVEETFKKATSEGGKFHGMMDQVADTGFGKMSTIMGNFQVLIAEVSEKFIDNMKPMLDVVINIVNWMMKHQDAVGAIIAVLVPLAAGITAVVAGMQAWAIIQSLVNVLLIANPIGLVITAIAALVSGVIYAYQTFDEFAGIIDGTWSYMKNLYDIFTDFFEDMNMDNFVTKFTGAFKKIKEYLVDFVKTTFMPFVEAWENVKRGNFAAAAKSLGEGVWNLTPFGQIQTLAEGIFATDAFQKGYKSTITKREEEDKASKKDLPGDFAAKGPGAANNDISGKGGSMQGITIKIENFGRIDNVTVASPDEIAQFETQFKRLMASVLNDSTKGFR